jgi:hypothetical protein
MIVSRSHPDLGRRALILTVVVLLASASSCTAWLVPTVRSARVPSLSRLATTPALDEIDEMCIENVAELCTRADAIVTMGGECDLDERDALVNQLENQRSALLARVELIDFYLQRLEGGEAVGENEDAVSNQQQYIPG